MQKEIFIEKLTEWYKFQKRELPWRSTKNPYKIWISEIILQQTRISQGLPYYHKFIDKYPKLENLANASEIEILRLWQGLGYYSRARNMLICAKTLQRNYGGNFPQRFEELRKLKGIGEYTAAAIASFAFEQNVAVVDGNVYRVLSRIFGIDLDIASNEGKKMFRKLANDLLPTKNADIYNQAIMEFGALQCVPKNPNCSICPLKTECKAYRNGEQDSFPVKLRKSAPKDRFFSYFVIAGQEGYYLKQRQPGDIWTGLYDFYLVEGDEKQDFDAAAWKAKSEHGTRFMLIDEPAVYRSLLSHQTIHATFFKVKFAAEPAGEFLSSNKLSIYSKKAIDELPKPIMIADYLNDEIY